MGTIEKRLKAEASREQLKDLAFRQSKMRFITKVNETLKEKGLNRSGLAARLDQSPAAVTKVLRPDQSPNMRTITDLAYELGYMALIDFEPLPVELVPPEETHDGKELALGAGSPFMHPGCLGFVSGERASQLLVGGCHD
jgi:hypothetical protein